MAHSGDVLNAPDGSALTWIFDHCLRYPGTYEIPLRTMYALNMSSTRCATPKSRRPETAFSKRSSDSSDSSNSSAQTQAQTQNQTQTQNQNQNQTQHPVDAASELRSQLSNLISRYPSQPGSLPPSFITSFLRRCFAANLDEVEFPQALTALDYLRDLDGRWRKEVAGALRRLGIESDSPNSQSELGRKWPGILSWIESVNVKIYKVEVLYSRIYIGLRRWVSSAG